MTTLPPEMLPKAEGDADIALPTVTRFEVIDHTASGEGRALVRYSVAVTLSYQDDGRTLKVFLTDQRQ